jgi:hypothetical protein
MVMLAAEDPSVDGHLASTPRRRGSDDIYILTFQMFLEFSYILLNDYLSFSLPMAT